MSILINKQTRVICQGITGKAGSFHTQQCVAYGSRFVAGISPKKGGQDFEGIPVYDTVKDAAAQHAIDASLIFVPAPFALAAIKEAIDARVPLIVVITEGIPVIDMVQAKKWAKEAGCRIIGPNCPGIITAEECKIGIMPGYIHKKGGVGVISRSGTLTYEAVWQLTQVGLGQTTCIGIGGDPVIGTSFLDLLGMFEKDPETKGVLILGEIGGTQEEEAARFVRANMKKPVAAFIAGATAPKGKRMGHAGAIISGSSGTAEEKYRVLAENGIQIVKNPSEIGRTMKGLLA